MTDLWGYADLHCHPAAHLAFGGQHASPGRGLLWGAPTGPLPNALPCCNPGHVGVFGGQGLLPAISDPHHGYGSTSYADWPQHDTTLHQQMHIAWTRRAFESGLRLMFALAVNNEMLANLAMGADKDNSDGTSIAAQLAHITETVADNASWMALVSEPGQARAAIEAGKLAIVLGVEVDTLGGFRTAAQCSPAQVQSLVDDLYAAGVRAVTPVHLADNAFGGCAITSDQFSILNHYLHDIHTPHGRFYEVDAAPDPGELAGLEFLLGRDPRWLAQRNAYPYAFPAYPQNLAGHLNAHGMTDRGGELLAAMMKRGMLIDVDHMSQYMRGATLDLAEQYAYPLLSTHSSFRELQLPRRPAAPNDMHGVANEGSLLRSEMERIAQLGGVVAPISHLGPIASYAHPDAPAMATEPEQDTSHSWSHAYLYALELMGERGVAIGTDFNGLAQQPGPRFPTTGGHPAWAKGPIQYGQDLIVMTQQVLQRVITEGRTFDLNSEGLAHYGMLPDFLRDVANQLPDEGLLAAFYRSAEDLIVCWETCVSAGGNLP